MKRKINSTTNNTKNLSNKVYAELQERSELFTLIANHTPALVSYIDTKERYKFTNVTYAEWLGLSPEETRNKTVKQMRGNEAYKVIMPNLRKALREGKKISYDHYLTKHDGKRIFVNAVYEPHKDDKGNIQGVFVLVSDITDRKETEMKLQETTERFNKIVDSNIIGVSIADLDGHLFEVNDVYLDMIGYTRKDFKAGKVDWKAMTPPEYLPINEKTEKEVLEKGSTMPYEKAYIKKDGSLVHVLIGNVLIDKSARKVIALVMDISKQKEQQQRRDEFIALASHELKTPLTSLQLFSEMIGLQIRKRSDIATYELFLKLEKQIAKVNKLVNSLLDVSRIHAGKLSYSKTNFSFTRLVNETVHEIQTVHETRSFLIQSSVDAHVRGDRERIKQVLINLLNNAVKYSAYDKKVSISVTKQKDMLKIGIIDKGIGISVPNQRTIFDRYYQINDGDHAGSSGMGLGLYLSKEIIERHNGEIWVESERGKGSTFYFTIPISIKY